MCGPVINEQEMRLELISLFSAQVNFIQEQSEEEIDAMLDAQIEEHYENGVLDEEPSEIIFDELYE